MLRNHSVTICYTFQDQSAYRWRYTDSVTDDSADSPLPPPGGVSQTLRRCPKWASHLIPHQTPCCLSAFVPPEKRLALPTRSTAILLPLGNASPVKGDGLFRKVVTLQWDRVFLAARGAFCQDNVRECRQAGGFASVGMAATSASGIALATGMASMHSSILSPFENAGTPFLIFIHSRRKVCWSS